MHRTSRIFDIGLPLSKWPHLHRLYSIRVQHSFGKNVLLFEELHRYFFNVDQVFVELLQKEWIIIIWWRKSKPLALSRTRVVFMLKWFWSCLLELLLLDSVTKSFKFHEIKLWLSFFFFKKMVSFFSVLLTSTYYLVEWMIPIF